MEQKPLNTKLKWFAIDLDATLAKDIWPEKGIGKPIKENIQKLLEVVDAGYKITIHTSRPWSDYEAVELWLVKNQVPFDRIVLGKVLALKYVDDKAVPADADSWL